jgi:hypothetical protein
MPLPLSLSRHMVDAITYEQCTGEDSFGARSYAAPVTYSRCRVVREAKPTKDAQGIQVTSMTQVYVDQVIQTLALRDRVTLPDGTTPPIINYFVEPRSPAGLDMDNTVIQV